MPDRHKLYQCNFFSELLLSGASTYSQRDLQKPTPQLDALIKVMEEIVKPYPKEHIKTIENLTDGLEDNKDQVIRLLIAALAYKREYKVLNQLASFTLDKTLHDRMETLRTDDKDFSSEEKLEAFVKGSRETRKKSTQTKETKKKSENIIRLHTEQIHQKSFKNKLLIYLNSLDSKALEEMCYECLSSSMTTLLGVILDIYSKQHTQRVESLFQSLLDSADGYKCTWTLIKHLPDQCNIVMDRLLTFLYSNKVNFSFGYRLLQIIKENPSKYQCHNINVIPAFITSSFIDSHLMLDSELILFEEDKFAYLISTMANSDPVCRCIIALKGLEIIARLPLAFDPPGAKTRVRQLLDLVPNQKIIIDDVLLECIQRRKFDLFRLLTTSPKTKTSNAVNEELLLRIVRYRFLSKEKIKEVLDFIKLDQQGIIELLDKQPLSSMKDISENISGFDTKLMACCLDVIYRKCSNFDEWLSIVSRIVVEVSLHHSYYNVSICGDAYSIAKGYCKDNAQEQMLCQSCKGRIPSEQDELKYITSPDLLRMSRTRLTKMQDISRLHETPSLKLTDVDISRQKVEKHPC